LEIWGEGRRRSYNLEILESDRLSTLRDIDYMNNYINIPDSQYINLRIPDEFKLISSLCSMINVIYDI